MLAGPAMADSAITPDPTLTPGAIRTTDSAEICSHGTRHWDRRRDDRIMTEYGLPSGPHPDYEVDHLIPLGIGGATDVRNLWPEPRRSVEPVWNAERKDRLELAKEAEDRIRKGAHWTDWMYGADGFAVRRAKAMGEAGTNQPYGKAYTRAFGD